MPEFDAIGTIAFFRERHRLEAAITAKVLRAMSPDMLDFRPHPESSTIAVIAWTMVRCLCICNRLTYSSVAEIPRDSPPEYEALLAAFENETRELNVRLLEMTQRDWEAERTVKAGNRILLQQPLGTSLWLFHVDSIHHRGQLSVLLRPLGAKVPSIYGPSGDCQPSTSPN
jgi:uncharacterized damage-inducible protein DinB